MHPPVTLTAWLASPDRLRPHSTWPMRERSRTNAALRSPAEGGDEADGGVGGPGIQSFKRTSLAMRLMPELLPPWDLPALLKPRRCLCDTERLAMGQSY